MRLIDADAKIKMLLYDEEHEEQITREMTIEEALDAYTEDGCPTTIDVAPREIGHWLPYEFGDYHWHKCSVCGKADKYIETIDNRGDIQAIRNFCPICGARMENDD